MRSIILKWLHRQDFYWDERWGLNDVEVEEEDEEDEEDQQGCAAKCGGAAK